MATRTRRRAGRTVRKPAHRARKAGSKRKAAARATPRSRAVPENLRLRATTPGLTVNDLERSLGFYGEALGFFVKERWTDDGGKLRGVMLKAGVCELGLSQDDWARGRERRKGEGLRLWLRTVQDLDALAARVEAAGFALTDPPKDQPWGARTFSVDDPDGFHLTLYRDGE